LDGFDCAFGSQISIITKKAIIFLINDLFQKNNYFRALFFAIIFNNVMQKIAIMEAMFSLI
jgi:hypothetical protein